MMETTPTSQTQADLNASTCSGVFTRRQAIEIGYAPGSIAHRLRTGQWLALRRGIYVERRRYQGCATEVERHALQVAAAILALDACDTVASHQSAGFLHGLALLRLPPTAIVSRPPAAPGRDRVRGVHVHRAALPAAHVGRALGIPTTSAARTAVDLARTLPFGEAVIAVDSALHLGLASRAELEQVLAGCRGWPGSQRAGTVVAFADAATESPLESLTRVMLAEQGLPPPVLQVPIDGGAQRIRVDFLWPAFATVVETDGLTKYDDPDALQREKLRQEALEELGVKVVRLTWQQVTREPERSAARIRRAFAAGPAEPAAIPAVLGAPLPLMTAGRGP